MLFCWIKSFLFVINLCPVFWFLNAKRSRICHLHNHRLAFSLVRGPHVFIFLFFDWCFTSYLIENISLVRRRPALLWKENRDVPERNPRPSVGWCKTFPLTAGQKTSISWTWTRSDHIAERLKSYCIVIARLLTETRRLPVCNFWTWVDIIIPSWNT